MGLSNMRYSSVYIHPVKSYIGLFDLLVVVKAVGQVAGAPINLPVQILELKMAEAQIKIERASNQTVRALFDAQKSFTHIHDRTFHNLNEVKMAVEDMEFEYKQKETEGESMANDLSFISAR
eukprot:174157-Prorocentrum_minimum.AAC.1